LRRQLNILQPDCPSSQGENEGRRPFIEPSATQKMTDRNPGETPTRKGIFHLEMAMIGLFNHGQTIAFRILQRATKETRRPYIEPYTTGKIITRNPKSSSKNDNSILK
jgi:hypothetical protein